LLSGGATVKFEGDQATLRSRQKQQADGRFHRCTEKSFHGMRLVPRLAITIARCTIPVIAR
jgi:hypothetical protein